MRPDAAINPTPEEGRSHRRGSLVHRRRDHAAKVSDVSRIHQPQLGVGRPRPSHTARGCTRRMVRSNIHSARAKLPRRSAVRYSTRRPPLRTLSSRSIRCSSSGGLVDPEGLSRRFRPSAHAPGDTRCPWSRTALGGSDTARSRARRPSSLSSSDGHRGNPVHRGWPLCQQSKEPKLRLRLEARDSVASTPRLPILHILLHYGQCYYKWPRWKLRRADRFS